MRRLLRESTRPLHDRVDALFEQEKISHPSGYARMLLIHTAIVPALESRIRKGGWVDDIPNLSSRWRSEDLFDDLADLQHSQPTPLCVSFVNDRASAAGSMYVLEGSRLGARVINSWLQSGDCVSLPKRFLNSSGEPGNWKLFVLWLAEQNWSGSEVDRMIEAAEGVFQAYLSADKGQIAA